MTSPSINNKLPFFLIFSLVAFPQVSENIYSPALSDMTSYFKTTFSQSEITLTTYFIGFALGVLFWGRLSDIVGRRPCVLYGILIYLISCLLLLITPSMELFILVRIFQGFGASTGSIMSITLVRDLYEGQERSQILSRIAIYLSLAPSLGPIVGGFLTDFYNWQANFIFLIVWAVILTLYSNKKLIETKPNDLKAPPALTLSLVKKVLSDRHVLYSALLIGSLNGILFSFYSEGPFLFIDNFLWNAKDYALLGIFFGLATMLGGHINKRLIKTLSPYSLIHGSSFILLLSALFPVLIPTSSPYWVVSLVGFMTCLFLMMVFIIANILGVALKNFSHIAGSAGGILNFTYYVIIAGQTFGMACLHNGLLKTFSFYALALSIIIYAVSRLFIKHVLKTGGV